uniref:Uncharacterized protein n=1 Tax=Romanomermis culicivorax TaxID=13658 RepID=A0A915IKA5_ROMCU
MIHQFPTKLRRFGSSSSPPMICDRTYHGTWRTVSAPHHEYAASPCSAMEYATSPCSAMEYSSIAMLRHGVCLG